MNGRLDVQKQLTDMYKEENIRVKGNGFSTENEKQRNNGLTQMNVIEKISDICEICGLKKRRNHEKISYDVKRLP